MSLKVNVKGQQGQSKGHIYTLQLNLLCPTALAVCAQGKALKFKGVGAFFIVLLHGCFNVVAYKTFFLDQPETTLLFLNDELTNWESNWLFRRRKTSGKFPKKFRAHEGIPYLYPDEPISMLVPNPSSAASEEAESDISVISLHRPTIGGTDVDNLSELSERVSIASSLEMTSEPGSSSDSESISSSCHE